VLEWEITTQEVDTLLRGGIRDAALASFEALKRHKLTQQVTGEEYPLGAPQSYIRRLLKEFQIHTSALLEAESKAMNYSVEALRGFLGLKKKRDYVFRRHDLGAIIADNVERFKPMVTEQGLRMSYEHRGNLNTECSELDLDRMISNIFVNAVKYSKPAIGRFIRVRAGEVTSLGREWVEFSVESFGIAIKKEELEGNWIFSFGNRGYFAQQSEKQGLGAGLSDAKETVEAHRGRIWLRSRPATDETESDPPQYKVPYLTTVAVQIPKVR
jgi:signal transduction histidine kinase